MRPAALLLAGMAAAVVPAARAVDLPARGTDQIAHMCAVAFGGMERWREVRDARYSQVVTRYDAGNKPRKERRSEIYLRYQPRRQCRIESRTENGRPHILVYDGERVQILVDGREEKDPDEQRRGLRNALSTLYLFALPFNLEEPGVVLTYRGKAESLGRTIYRLEADVRRGPVPSPADTFEYWIDAETYQIPQVLYTLNAEGVTYVVQWEQLSNLGGVLKPLRWNYMATPRQRAMSVEFQGLQLNAGLADSLFRISAPPKTR
jgi:outer membrane lipoprotein-sorting protein